MQNDLIDEFVNHIIDSMDMDCLITIVRDKLDADFSQMSENDFMVMVESHAPHLIESE